MRLTLRQLEVFVAVCRHGGISAAGNAISLSQSAASQALAELESSLDGPLFDRTGRRLILNERGRTLLPEAADLLDRAREIEMGMRERSDGLPPVNVRLAASLTVGSYLLPKLLGAYLAEHPQARVQLDIMNTRDVMIEVAAFRVDAGFVEGPCQHPDLGCRPWRQDRLIVIAAPDHPLAGREVTPDDLSAARWVLRERGSGTREVFEQACAKTGVRLRDAIELGHTEAVQRAVMAGAGLGAVSRVAVEDPLARGDLVTIETPFLDLDRTLRLVLHQRKHLSAGLREILMVCGVDAETIADLTEKSAEAV